MSSAGDKRKASEPYYRTIDGVKYDNELLTVAEESVKGEKNPVISVAESKQIFEKLIDGTGITEIEYAPLEYIKKNFKFTDAGAKNLKDLLAEYEAKKGNKKQKTEEEPKEAKAEPVVVDQGYYRIIDGVKYDKAILETADASLKDEKNPVISVAESDVIYEKIIDGNKITDIEKATIEYLYANYKFTDAAKKNLEGKLAAFGKPAPTEEEAKEAKAEPVVVDQGYYRIIDGVKYDKALLEAADESVKDEKNPVISVAESTKLLEKTIDGNKITDIEKATVEYIKKNYKFTDAAQKNFTEGLEAFQNKNSAA